MKVVVTIGFTGDRDAFAGTMVDTLSTVVGTGGASRASLDVRLPDERLRELGDDLVTEREERAVVMLWDAAAGTALGLTLPPGSRAVGAYHVEEAVQKDYGRSWPSGERSPGFKMIAFLRRRPDLTAADFSRHWRDRHGPLAVARQPGFWRYVQNHVVGALTTASPPWDGIGEIHFRDVDAALRHSYDSEEARQLIWEDVARFLDYERCPTLTTDEWVLG